ncbi:RWD-domain-containing protein [Pseudovirgaria hyperparasitica]|uniref:RBR-type E3 ubiquitin transferase n=1 Tax=Pseudovirgaria hyperparasitica TaxID=470096 RepID=A0A6A6W1T6_9PEZI|nr:RWD-domain-containing protein [Pseudovirgaria hyperparasitica]KAF2755537.1 RWD-domain-containing protein [Pseudovirgaria hyperparasitica]
MEDDNALEEREEELSSIAAIFPELELDDKEPFRARLEIPVELASPLRVCFPASTDGEKPPVFPTPPSSEDDGHARSGKESSRSELQTHDLCFLPAVRLDIALPHGYPESVPPEFILHATVPWVPQATLNALQQEGEKLWDEYGHSQVVFGYIDFLQQAAERAFDLASGDLAMELPGSMRLMLLDYDKLAKRRKFEQSTYDCGVCLEPKRGSSCYKMARCGHVFCVSCLRDFYTSCINEGDVVSVKCMDPSCGKDPKLTSKKRKQRTLGPSELLQIPLDNALVKRYVNLKRKKKIEADKTTIYCPRKWCQGPARSTKYPKITSFDNYADSDSEPEDEIQALPDIPPHDPNKIDRLAICEDCEFAFCRVCLAGWHGDFVRCWPRTAAELSEDEQASYNYIRANTSPCPTCNSPVQKTHGCNHMTCFQCRSHFCYLCSAWLDSANPYQHFNNPGTSCFQRLWELEEGDNGQGAHFDGPRAAEIAALEVLQADLHAEAEALVDQNENVVIPEHGRARQEAELFAEALNELHLRQQDEPAVRVPDRARGPVPIRELPGMNFRIIPPRRAGIERFIEMALNDEEDAWDSDELDDSDDDFANLR